MDVTRELSVVEDGPRMVCVVRPGRSRTADEAVGFVLLPILVASVTATMAYVLVYLAVAVSGSDPAIALVSWRSGFLVFAGVCWVGSSAWQWTQVPHGGGMRHELKVDTDSVTLLAGGGVGFHVLLHELRDAAVVHDGIRLVQITRDGDSPVRVAMGGNTEEAADWVARTLRSRAEAVRNPPVGAS